MKARPDDVVTFPITGWATATLPDRNAMLEVQYITSPFERVADPQLVRFAMTVTQAKLLADALQRLADAAAARHDTQDDEPH